MKISAESAEADGEEKSVVPAGLQPRRPLGPG